MLAQKQIDEIREHLAQAQNPLFFFDNDNDGLISFLLLQRFLGRGKGVASKGARGFLVENYYRKVRELKPDYIFILDVPCVEPGFLKQAHEDNLPVVWIDHHIVDKPKITKDKEIYYYNVYKESKTNEPVSYLCYKIADKKQDIWLAVIGCISDFYIPDFYPEFEKKFPGLGKKNPKTPFDVLYASEIGKIAQILDFSLKDRTTNVVKMMRFMMKAKGPMDILEENPKTKRIVQRYEQVDSKYQKLMERAREKNKEGGKAEGKMIYFQYGGSLSLSSNLANQLSYEFPEKIIVVVYVNQDVANLSLRGREVDIREMTLEAIEGLEGATGGGHKNATGAKISASQLPKFKKKFLELVEKV